MTEYHVVVSDQAKLDAGNHVAFLAEKSEEAARELQTRLITAIRTLCEMPMRYPFFNEPYIPPNKYHKMFVKKYYLVLYQVKDDCVFVDMILDARQELPWLLR
ncbi:MAG: type II toxin-antitoxin system RelE/ParE family toxin [Sphaerochaeta sp.]|nr:type II toxin-antitoxin system RelE/ParE family toxin [Sphaerochaeta sp.]MDD3512445.1 type II toxin-antitoxin system RelE/ParE family toxin [Synergistaceae bacterium]MDD3916246.1 type II toxin-antitoxin system RelE/ParE family toxin [Synergistaceae bacterium]